MFDNDWQSDRPAPTAISAVVPACVRGDSEIRATFAAISGATRLTGLYERGSLRLRRPRTGSARTGTARENVIINTGGGITGGDRIALDIKLGDDADAVLTSQAAEKIYRAEAEAASIVMTANLGTRARLCWLPQETILFDRAAAHRTLTLDMAGSASLTMLESLVLGRIAHGETLQYASWRDRWRIRRDGRLAFADDIRLEGPIADIMAGPAVGAGARSIATLLHIAPDAEQRLALVRAALATAQSTCGSSAFNGILIVRFVAGDPQAVRRDAVAAVTALTNADMPRAWGC